MSDMLTEEEMRAALFGQSSAVQPKAEAKGASAAPPPIADQPPSAKPVALKTRRSSPKLCVTLHVTKVFEGDVEVFTYEASTLTTLVAEQEAKAAARKKKFKYMDLVSIVQI